MLTHPSRQSRSPKGRGVPPSCIVILKSWVKQTFHAGHIREVMPKPGPGGSVPSAGHQWVLNELFHQEPVSTPASGSLPMHKAASPSVSLRTCWAPDPGSIWSTACCLRPGTCPTLRQRGQRKNLRAGKEHGTHPACISLDLELGKGLSFSKLDLVPAVWADTVLSHSEPQFLYL
jgi:hypothetical protein